MRAAWYADSIVSFFARCFFGSAPNPLDIGMCVFCTVLERNHHPLAYKTKTLKAKPSSAEIENIYYSSLMPFPLKMQLLYRKRP